MSIEVVSLPDLMHNAGGATIEAEKILSQIIAGLKEGGGQGSVNIKFLIKRDAEGMVAITPSVTGSHPTKAYRAINYFTTSDDKLSMDDPTVSSKENVRSLNIAESAPKNLTKEA